jgi:hypothetical protein
MHPLGRVGEPADIAAAVAFLGSDDPAWITDEVGGFASPVAAWNHRGVHNGGPVQVQLNAEERAVVRAGLLDWGGPARPTDALAVAMGFTDAAALSGEARALWEQIDRSLSLTAQDWRRVLLAVEIVFVSDVVGSGLDWRFTSGFSDAETIDVIRGLQRKLPRWRGSFQFTRDDGGI